MTYVGSAHRTTYMAALDPNWVEIHTLYLDDGDDIDICNPSYARDPSKPQCVEGASFLKLPSELRNIIYELALQRPRHVRIGAKYTCDLPEKYTWITPKYSQRTRWDWPAYIARHVPRQFLSSDIASLQRLCVKEQCPPLAIAVPLAKREILSVHYAVNKFKVQIRNTLERRAFVDWCLLRRELLKGIRCIRTTGLVRMGHRNTSYRWGFRLQKVGEGIDARCEIQDDNKMVLRRPACDCTLESRVARRLSLGRSTHYDEVRVIDVGSLARVLLGICEACELAEEAWVARDMDRQDEEVELNVSAEDPVNKARCPCCGRREVFLI